MLRESIESGIPFDRLFLLTAQDYPLISKRQLHEILVNDPHKEYIIGYNFTKTENKAQIERTTVFHLFRDAPEWLHLRTLSRWIMKALPIRKPQYLTVNGKRWDIYYSSSYMCISPKLATYIYNTMHKRKEIERYFKTAYVPEEFVIPTIVFNSPFKQHALLHDAPAYPGLSNLSAITYFDYSSKIHVFDETDYELLMGCGKMFARKFSSTTSAKLMKMLQDKNRG